VAHEIEFEKTKGRHKKKFERLLEAKKKPEGSTKKSLMINVINVKKTVVYTRVNGE